MSEYIIKSLNNNGEDIKIKSLKVDELNKSVKNSIFSHSSELCFQNGCKVAINKTGIFLYDKNENARVVLKDSAFNIMK